MPVSISVDVDVDDVARCCRRYFDFSQLEAFAMRAFLRLRHASAVPAYGTGRRGNKLTTGLHGLPVHPNPLPTLLDIYRSTLSALSSKIPAGVVYRQSAEAITQNRIDVIQRHAGSAGSEGGEPAIEAVEREIGQGVIEELIKAAETERSLVGKMAEWKR